MFASSESRVREGTRLVETGPEPQNEAVVLALGNPLRGDDGVGAAVLSALESRPGIVATTFVDGGTPGLETVLVLQGYRRAIILDAADMGKEPGTWRRFTPDEVGRPPRTLAQSVHEAGLAEALSLGAALGTLPESIVIYGIQPGTIGWQPGLTRRVEAAIPAVVDAVIDDLCGALRLNDEDG